MNKEIIRNVFINIFAQVITLVIGFILPPLIITTYGSAQNGMVASIAQFIAYLSVVEAGIGAASIAALTKPLYNNDKNQINSIIAATQNFYSKAGSIFAFMILLLAFIYPHIVEYVDKFSACFMVLVLSIGGILDFFVIGKYRVLLIADRKNYIMVIFRIINIILSAVVSIILIENGNSLLLVKFTSVLIYVSGYAMIFVYVKKHYCFINLKTKFDKNTLEQKWDVMCHRVSGMVLDNSPLVLLTIFCSLSEVSIYSIYSMIFLAIDKLIDTLSDGMQGFFGRFLAENNPNKMKKIYEKYETVYFLIIGICYTCALILTIPFMQIYARNMTDANYIQPTLVVLFVAVGIMNKLRQPAIMLYVSAGHFKQTKWQAIAEAVINISASIFFVIKFGFTGVLLGSVCSLAYRTLDIIIYSSKNVVHNSLLITFTKVIVLGIWYYIGYFILYGYMAYNINSYLDFVKNAGTSFVFLAIPTLIYLFYIKKVR
ncbi:MAG: hypothetical protein LBH98_07555 [Chitinispirillales bacterium]|jgi:O-antigen/teichoic acid export membrane protein|nr:hypothetical protein [Chitinispirillales bacterium]